MESIGPYLVGVAFWLFVGSVSIAGIVSDYKRRRGGVDVLRMAIEKGQQLDPSLIEKLTSNDHRDERVNHLHVKLGGIITLAAGVGICLLSFFIGHIAPIALYPILGAGVVALCVGAGLVIGANMLAEARTREQSRNNLP
jgi:Domain of unknown function (DUF6249)